MIRQARRRPPVFGVLCLALLFMTLALGFRAGYAYFYQRAYPIAYRQLVEEHSAANGLDPMLVYAVIRTESGFRSDVTSSVGARGLMQLTEDTYKWARYRRGESQDDLDYNDLYDPETNIRYGTVVLRLLLEEFGDEPTALAAYHAGWGSVKGWLEDKDYSADGMSLDAIPFVDTGKYVPKVLATKRMYENLYIKGTDSDGK